MLERPLLITSDQSLALAMMRQFEQDLKLVDASKPKSTDSPLAPRCVWNGLALELSQGNWPDNALRLTVAPDCPEDIKNNVETLLEQPAFRALTILGQLRTTLENIRFNMSKEIPVDCGIDHQLRTIIYDNGFNFNQIDQAVPQVTVQCSVC